MFPLGAEESGKCHIPSLAPTVPASLLCQAHLASLPLDILGSSTGLSGMPRRKILNVHRQRTFSQAILGDQARLWVRIRLPTPVYSFSKRDVLFSAQSSPEMKPGFARIKQTHTRIHIFHAPLKTWNYLSIYVICSEKKRTHTVHRWRPQNHLVFCCNFSHFLLICGVLQRHRWLVEAGCWQGVDTNGTCTLSTLWYSSTALHWCDNCMGSNWWMAMAKARTPAMHWNCMCKGHLAWQHGPGPASSKER